MAGRDAGGDGVESMTVVEIAAQTYVNERPGLTLCGGCYGEDFDTIDSSATLVTRTYRHLHIGLLPLVDDLRERVELGQHRRGGNRRDRRHTWQIVGALRSRMPGPANPPGVPAFLERLATQAATSDPDIARWVTSRLDAANAAVAELAARMRRDREAADQEARAGDTGRTGSARPAQLLVPSVPATTRWTFTENEVAQLINTEDPVGWLTLDVPTPVFVAPYDRDVATSPEAVYLGDADRLSGPELAVRLEVATLLMKEAAPGTPLRHVRTAFRAACAIFDEQAPAC